MNRTIVFSALSLALVLGGASGALAAGKKHSPGHEAYAAVGAAPTTDPRVNKGSNHEGWCDLDAQCNGWAAWLQDVNAGKLSAGH